MKKNTPIFSFVTLFVITLIMSTSTIKAATTSPDDEMIDESKTLSKKAQIMEIGNDDDPFEGMNIDDDQSPDDDDSWMDDADDMDDDTK